MATTAELIDLAVAAHARLADVGEVVAEEWQYIQDLRAAWAARLAELRANRGSLPASPAASAAIAQLAIETAGIVDPHRAIDWLSTLPQVALLALGEDRF
ncbi:MAG: hypothetical protein L0221_19255 [Chloroflexi bacterium]|nr:hypothetical protein [Chloroflexota bacterium]